MLSSAWVEKRARIAREGWDLAASPARFWLLLQMILWGAGLRHLRPHLSIARIVRVAVPAKRGKRAQSSDVIRCLEFLDRILHGAKEGECLPRALLFHRFLSLAGANSTLWIGFDADLGHAWVEVDGKPFLEPEISLLSYRRTLAVQPGSRRLVRMNLTGSNL